MKQRIVTAIIAGISFLVLVIIGEIPFLLLVYVMASVGLFEMFRMKQLPYFSIHFVISLCFLWALLSPIPILDFTKMEIIYLLALFLLSYVVLTKNVINTDDVSFILLSIIYLGMGFYFLIEARDAGLAYIFYALFVIWATDSGAYFIGKSFGTKKLWPLISPNKTIEGFFGGIGCALVVAAVFHFFFPIHDSFLYVLVVTTIISIFGQLGDLAESAIKRHYHVKDSGSLLPGHGGILDRFDSLLFVLPLLHFLHII